MAAQDTGAVADTLTGAMATDAGVMPGAMLVATPVMDSMAETPSRVEADSVAEVVVGSRAEACRTVEAVFTAAVVDVGNAPASSVRRLAAPSCQPFFFISALYPPPAFLLECAVTQPLR